jgi:hypothetical protein
MNIYTDIWAYNRLACYNLLAKMLVYNQWPHVILNHKRHVMTILHVTVLMLVMSFQHNKQLNVAIHDLMITS